MITNIMPFFGLLDVTFLALFMLGVSSGKKQYVIAGVYILFLSLEVFGLV